MSTLSDDSAPTVLLLPARARVKGSLTGPEAVQMRTPGAKPLDDRRLPSTPGVRVNGRANEEGWWRYTGTYTLAATTGSGAKQRPSAGTYDTWWEAFEAASARQRTVDQRRGRDTGDMTVSDYYHNHFISKYPAGKADNTAKNSESCFSVHILPSFGTLSFDEITVADVDHWVHGLIDSGLELSTVDTYLGRFRAFINHAIKFDAFTGKNPCDAVDAPGKGKRIRTLRPREWFEALRPQFEYGRLTLLFVDLTIETGLRFGEITALRPRDLIVQAGKPYLIIAHNIVWPGTAKTKTNSPCKENDYLKGDAARSSRRRGKRAERKIRISDSLYRRLLEERQLRELSNQDIYFEHAILRAERNGFIGFVKNDDECPKEPIVSKGGRVLNHGTPSAYNAGCHGRACREARTAHQQAKRAIKTGRTLSNRPGDVGPRQGSVGERIDWMSNQWWNELVWNPAVEASGIAWDCSFHDLRHAHATWLLRAGTDIYKVKERLGHSTLQHTEDYIGLIDDCDDWEADKMTQLRDSIYEPAKTPPVSFTLSADNLSQVASLDQVTRMALIAALATTQ